MNKIYDSYRPNVFETINGYLFVEKPNDLIDFVQTAFDAEEINRSMKPQNGDISNVILKIGISSFMISQARGEFINMRTSFYLYVNNVDEIHSRAVQYGAKVEFEPADMYYRDRQSGIIDPSGNY